MTSAGSEFPYPAPPGVEWRLRMAAAERGVWTGSQLRRLMAEKAGLELSPASVSALFTKEPSQVKLSTLAALCVALDCAPGDLLALEATAPAVVPVPRESGVRPAVTVPTATRTRSLPPL